MSKKLTFKILIGAFVLILASSVSYSRIWYNYSECGYEGECDGGGTSSGTGEAIGTAQGTGMSIGVLIVESAGHLTKSYSNMVSLLNTIEMSELNGTDFSELRETLYITIEEMEKANEAISNLKTVADNRQYYMPVIYRLWFFDYRGFQNEKGLLPGIFDNVQFYLARGDIRGVYTRALNDSVLILNRLYDLKEWLETDKLPDISKFWQINQDYMSLILFGQYTSTVFKEIL